MESDRKRWDRKYRGREFVYGRNPVPFLKNHLRFLEKGSALDLACGEGRNAVFLALHGCHVEAVDISSVALKKGRELAKAAGVEVDFIRADLDSYPLPREKYDLISVFYFWDRRLIPRIKKGVKRGGRVVFETYTRETLPRNLEGPREAKYLLRPNELLRVFSGFRILFYREGVFREGGRLRAVASLIAQKM
jgi:tellurite methyltransferase